MTQLKELAVAGYRLDTQECLFNLILLLSHNLAKVDIRNL